MTFAIVTNFGVEVGRYETWLEAEIEAADLEWKANCSNVVGRTYEVKEAADASR